MISFEVPPIGSNIKNKNPVNIDIIMVAKGKKAKRIILIFLMSEKAII
jgi:hypothetical protein